MVSRSWGGAPGCCLLLHRSSGSCSRAIEAFVLLIVINTVVAAVGTSVLEKFPGCPLTFCELSGLCRSVTPGEAWVEPLPGVDMSFSLRGPVLDASRTLSGDKYLVNNFLETIVPGGFSSPSRQFYLTYGVLGDNTITILRRAKRSVFPVADSETVIVFLQQIDTHLFKNVLKLFLKALLFLLDDPPKELFFEAFLRHGEVHHSRLHTSEQQWWKQVC